MTVPTFLVELESIAAEQPAAWPWVQQVRRAHPDFATRAPLVVAAAAAAGLCAYRTVALLLKLQRTDRAPKESNRVGHRLTWQSRLASLREPSGTTPADLTAADLEMLVIEQHALACDELDMVHVAALAARHERENALLATTAAAERAAFLVGKRGWLIDEIQLDELHALRRELVDELESTRMQYLFIAGRTVVDLVEAAHRLALLRYRVALNDPTLTAEELNMRLQHDLHADDGVEMLVRLEPELRRALLDSEQGAQADYDLLRHLSHLHDDGRLQPATEAERKEAEAEFRRLARLIHPDALERHPRYGDIAPQNERRLKEIWHLASATHGARVYLSRHKLLDYLANLRQWKEEVLRILRDISFPTPSLLLQGDTFETRHADLRRAMDDVERHLHAVRDDIAALEFDALHEEYRRVLAMGEDERSAERERMAALAVTWNAEALQLAAQLQTRCGGAAPDASRRQADCTFPRRPEPRP